MKLTEIENMMPWERDIYLGLLNQYVEEENMRIQQQNLNGSIRSKSKKFHSRRDC